MSWDGVERRSDSIKIAQIVGKLDSFMSTSEKNQEHIQRELDTKLDTVVQKIQSIDQKLDIQIDRLNSDLDKLEQKGDIILGSHRDENSKEHLMLIERLQDTKNQFSKRLDTVEKKVECIEGRVTEVENRNTTTKAKTVDAFLSVFQRVLFYSIATGLVGLIAFLILTYIRSL